jgi:hypothetical protein
MVTDDLLKPPVGVDRIFASDRLAYRSAVPELQPSPLGARPRLF